MRSEGVVLSTLRNVTISGLGPSELRENQGFGYLLLHNFTRFPQAIALSHFLTLIPSSTKTSELEGDRLGKTLPNLWKTPDNLWKSLWNLWGKPAEKIRIAKFYQF